MDLEVGQKAQREMKVDTETVRQYAEITGDYNPLHFDAKFARRTRFGRLIAQGGITTGLLHALVAMDMPGPGSVFVRQRWSFPAPVYIGDTLQADATVKSVRPKRNMAELEFAVKNQDGELVLEGDALVLQDDGGQ
ncbi:MAG: MaoC family dehydratase [Chloroflexi bacterium]|nr:MaoC family dehydratase [Chloroflexota bacterium]